MVEHWCIARYFHMQDTLVHCVLRLQHTALTALLPAVRA